MRRNMKNLVETTNQVRATDNVWQQTIWSWQRLEHGDYWLNGRMDGWHREGRLVCTWCSVIHAANSSPRRPGGREVNFKRWRALEPELQFLVIELVKRHIWGVGTSHTACAQPAKLPDTFCPTRLPSSVSFTPLGDVQISVKLTRLLW